MSPTERSVHGFILLYFCLPSLIDFNPGLFGLEGRDSVGVEGVKLDAVGLRGCLMMVTFRGTSDFQGGGRLSSLKPIPALASPSNSR